MEDQGREGDLGPATVLSHIIGYLRKFFPLLEGGNGLKTFSGANFCFWVSVLFFGAVLPMFLLYFSVFFRSISGLVFLGFFLSSFGFFADVVALFCFCFSF